MELWQSVLLSGFFMVWGILLVLTAILRWRWLLEGGNWLYRKYHLADRLWHRIVIGIVGVFWFAFGIVFLVTRGFS